MDGPLFADPALKLRWEPTDNWTIDTRVNLMYDRDDDRGNSCYAYPDADLIAALEAELRFTVDRTGHAPP